MADHPQSGTTTATGTMTDYTAKKPDTVSPLAARVRSSAKSRQRDLVADLVTTSRRSYFDLWPTITPAHPAKNK